jgi:peptidoglycan hydrolase-like protein with peptidoglycan-binding domain
MPTFESAARTRPTSSRPDRDRGVRSDAPATVAVDRGPLESLDLLRLQGLAGNAAVVRLMSPPGAAAHGLPTVLQRDPIGTAPPEESTTSAGGSSEAAAHTPTPRERPELEPGDGPSTDVGILQQKLNATGSATPPLRITAMYTPPTTAAVTTFQASHGLPPTGTTDSATWTQLDQAAPDVVRNGRVVIEGPGGGAPEGVPEGGTHPTIRRGSRGPAVEELQQRLNNAPAEEVPTLLEVDGKFGPMTRQAVVEFQRSHPPLEPDGVVGPLTWGMVDQIPGGVTVGRVETSWRERVEGNLYFQDTKYTWRLSEDALEVTVNIRFTGLRNHPQIAVWLGQILAVWNVFRFQDRSDPTRVIHLRMNPARATPADNSVRVYSADPDTPAGRSDSANWNVRDTDVSLAPHEFGHLIGLQDEYRRGADAYPVVTGEEPLVGAVTGDAEPQAVADELWTALNSSPASGRAERAGRVVSSHHLSQGAFAQRIAEAYETTHAAELRREDWSEARGYHVVPNPGGRIEDDIAARLPGQAHEAEVTDPFTYTNRSLMGSAQSLTSPAEVRGVPASHDHPVEERHVRQFLRIVQANRPGDWRVVRE